MKTPVPFGKFLLLDRINVGGMAEVFYAKVFGEKDDERIIAIKKILPAMVEDEEFISMFIDEARIAVQLDHRNVVQIFDLGQQEENYYIAMEYVAGRDLRGLLDRVRKRKEPLSLALAAYIGAEITTGLDYAHKAKDQKGNDLNIIHRDISPQNILISYEGAIKVIDFGIAKAANRAQKTQAGILKGKFGYMSPEQVRGMPMDRRSDLFAVGVILYEMLTGERLFVGDSDFSVLERVRNAEVPPPRKHNMAIPAELERIVLKLLEREVDKRYQWGSEVAADLRKFIAIHPVPDSENLQFVMKKVFAEEIKREDERMVRFAAIERPASVPPVSLRQFSSNRPTTGMPTMMMEDQHTVLVGQRRSTTQEWEADATGQTNPSQAAMPSPSVVVEPLGSSSTLILPQADEPPILTPKAPVPAAKSLPAFTSAKTEMDVTEAPAPSRPARPPLVRPPMARLERTKSGETMIRPAAERERKSSTALVAIIAAGVAALGVIAFVLIGRHEAASEGTLVITTHPHGGPGSGVDVEVDAAPVPVDPDGLFVVKSMAAGEHLVLAKGPGGDKVVKATVNGGSPTQLDIVLPTRPGPEPTPPPTPQPSAPPPPPAVAHEAPAEVMPVQLTIQTEPPDADLSVDETPVGPAPYVFSADPRKTYVFSAELQGYRTARKKARFSESQTLLLTLEPNEARERAPETSSKKHRGNKTSNSEGGGSASGSPGQLVISSSETARVFIDGKPTNRYTPVPPSDPLEISSGDHLIHLQSDDGKQADEHVTIKAHTINKLLSVALH